MPSVPPAASAHPSPSGPLRLPVTSPVAEREVVELCRDLLRFESVNRGDGDGHERPAAEYVAGKLAEVGIEPTLLESAPGRTSVIARIEGRDPSRPPLLIHSHLDVVPADASQWRVGPFSGEEVDGCLWGRGAVDMKDMVAMTLAVVRDIVRSGRRPPRDLVVAFLADEEAGGVLGARWLVENHRDHFADCTEAIGEVGGFSYTVSDDLRLYLIETAEKGLAWMRLTATGRAGHGSMISDDNAVTALCEAVARLGRHEFPLVLTPTVRVFLGELGEALGVEFDLDDLQSTVSKLGPIARMIGATLRNTVNPTALRAGEKVNVIPGQASALVDGRYLPGQEEEFNRQLDEILGPDIHREWIVNDAAVETSFDGDLVAAMAAALRAEDPIAHPVPYMLSGGTDAKSFSRLGIRCFGFSPLLLPADLDFAGMFHGVDERVPVESLRFGVRVLDRFLQSC
ncbi:M20/M25/M40 family metallo-hydrolase [Frankia sp. AgKG'84/4]|uniref:M20/M25/M40 family metallo-hydrolase n=1 Tax=Frankia sp. AgKG'84/4 TaxID=573490 RepID=UPI00200BA692|nr:M20/M25/M40 family metallo-hydrolase [Frankia sp. AgKG'84/4]MCL9794141.1 M20/M25/M40 family metallo-hydrolase [Frankia sp. AgKG'84/4]